jgi:hypothetical protein
VGSRQRGAFFVSSVRASGHRALGQEILCASPESQSGPSPTEPRSVVFSARGSAHGLRGTAGVDRIGVHARLDCWIDHQRTYRETKDALGELEKCRR